MALRIGITIGLQHEAESVWNNGIKQNAVFLAETLRACANVQSVVLVNTTVVPLLSTLPWDRDRLPTHTFDEVKDAVDVMIELGGQVSAEQTEYIKRRGAWLVSYCCGSEYVAAMESVLFNRPSFGHNLFINQRYDGVWMIPQVAGTSGHYFSTYRRRAAQVVPFVWSPYFLEKRAMAFPNGGAYRPRSGPRRLSVMEPNINVVKFCLYPILIAEEAFRVRPDLVAFLHVTNAIGLAEQSKEFVSLMNLLDIVRAGKASFVGRYDTPQFLAEMSDVVISHQWGNPLNYFYLEVCWQGFPLVHNASMCRDLGYYYPDNDVQAGRDALLEAMSAHDAHWDRYSGRQREVIRQFLPSNPQNIIHYEGLLSQLTQHPPV